MPLPLSTAGRNAIRADRTATAWFLELFCDGGTLRGWDQDEEFVLGGDLYEPVGGKWWIEGELKPGVDLVSEPFTIMFDGAEQYDDTSFIGRLLDRTWYQREIRLRQVCFEVDSNFVTPISTIYELWGLMDTIDAPDGDRSQSTIPLNCESGTFRAQSRNMQTCTDLNQRERAPNDGAFKNVATKPFQSMPFATKWENVPGAAQSDPKPAFHRGAGVMILR
jgi:hypothetical protein